MRFSSIKTKVDEVKINIIEKSEYNDRLYFCGHVFVNNIDTKTLEDFETEYNKECKRYEYRQFGFCIGDYQLKQLLKKDDDYIRWDIDYSKLTIKKLIMYINEYSDLTLYGIDGGKGGDNPSLWMLLKQLFDDGQYIELVITLFAKTLEIIKSVLKKVGHYKELKAYSELIEYINSIKMCTEKIDMEFIKDLINSKDKWPIDFIADDRLKNKTKIEKCIMKSLNYSIYNKMFWMKKKDYTA